MLDRSPLRRGSQRGRGSTPTTRRVVVAASPIVPPPGGGPVPPVLPESEVPGLSQFLDTLKFDSNGMLVAIVQVTIFFFFFVTGDDCNGKVLCQNTLLPNSLPPPPPPTTHRHHHHNNNKKQAHRHRRAPHAGLLRPRRCLRDPPDGPRHLPLPLPRGPLAQGRDERALPARLVRARRLRRGLAGVPVEARRAGVPHGGPELLVLGRGGRGEG